MYYNFLLYIKKILSFIVYSNAFYAICMLLLSFVASIDNHIPFCKFYFYIFSFIGTVVYYTAIYRKNSYACMDNTRTQWYIQYHKYISVTYIICILILLIIATYTAVHYWFYFFGVHMWYYALVAVFPFAAFLYTFSFFSHRSLRNMGWIKPFALGWVWAGMCYYFPIACYNLQTEPRAYLILPHLLLFFDNFIFISILCILFDIKDIESDKKKKLQTFPISLGISRTVYYIVLPLVLCSWLLRMDFVFSHLYTKQMVVLQSLPYILLLLVTYSLFKKKSLLYWLFVVDGLMIVKAVVGIYLYLFL